MASVWKLNNGKSPYYIGQYRDAEGTRVTRSTKQTDRKLAQKTVDEWENASKIARRHELTQAASVKVLDSLMQMTTGERFQQASIQEFLREWLANRNTMGRASATSKRYHSQIEGLISYLGNSRAKGSIASLSVGEIESWRNAEIAAGKGATTADFGVATIRAALESARRKGIILANPADAIEKIGKSAEERLPFTLAELQALYEVSGSEWRGMIALGVHAGLRLADAANLTWESVDFEQEALSFWPGKTRNS